MVEWRDRFGKKGLIMEKGYIYKISCLLNDKVYIGQTIKNINYRFNQHYTEAIKFNRENQLYVDMVEYGKDNFEITMIEELCCENYFDLKSKLNEREVYYINKFNSLKNGYNISKGNYKNKKITKNKRINLQIEFEKYNKIIKNMEKNNFKSLTEFIIMSCLKYKENEVNEIILEKQNTHLKNQNTYLENQNTYFKNRICKLEEIILWDRLPLLQKIKTKHPLFERRVQ